MALKELIFGYKRYCVKAEDPRIRACVDKCFPTMAEARAYKRNLKKGYYIRVIKQRRPFRQKETSEEEEDRELLED